jgi:Fe-S cluster assembly protein SufD
MIIQPGLEQETFKHLLEKFRSQAHWKDHLHGMRQKAWKQFLTLGLPSRENEAYHAIKLRQLFSQPYDLVSSYSIQAEQITPWIYPECERSVLVFVNGDYAPNLSNLEALPSKVVIAPLQEAILTYGTFLHNHWNQALKNEKDPFAVLNGALHRQGVFIYLPPRTVLEDPIQILHLIYSPDQVPLLMPRVQLFASTQAKAQIVGRQKYLTPTAYCVNQLTELVLEEAAQVSYTQALCDEHSHAWHFDAVRATLKRQSRLNTVCVTKGSATVRTDYHVSLVGEEAEALLNGVCMLTDKHEAHVQVMIDHQAPHCRSYQLFKGIVNHFGRSSFEGEIMVRQPAQQTEAFQLNNHLLLNDHARANSKPKLKIFADNVKASHGATVGQLDEDQLFYMRTRGLTDEQAKNLLIDGFCKEVIQKLFPASLKAEMEAFTLTRNVI